MARRENNKKKSGGIGDFISTLVIIVALGVFCYAGYQLFTIYMDYKVGVDEYAAIEELIVRPQTEGMQTEQMQTEGSERADEMTGSEAETKKEKTVYGIQRTTEGFDEERMEENNTLGDNWGNTVLDEKTSGKVFEKMENPIDFARLEAINSDVIGWIEMEAIGISYPVVQGTDNNYYLHRTIQKTDNFAGTIFMDFQNHKNFGDRNSILYGHNMKNGSMFGLLKKYREQETYDKSPYFWIYTEDFIYKYEIYSCAEVDQYSKDYQITFRTRESFEDFLTRTKNQSAIDTGVDVKYGDTVITLSTCTGNDATRFIVQGKRVRTYKAVEKLGGYETEVQQ